MKAACFAFDVMAVKCFNNADFQVHVDVSFTMRKLTCSAKVSSRYIWTSFPNTVKFQKLPQYTNNLIEYKYKLSRA